MIAFFCFLNYCHIYIFVIFNFNRSCGVSLKESTFGRRHPVAAYFATYLKTFQHSSPIISPIISAAPSPSLVSTARILAIGFPSSSGDSPASRGPSLEGLSSDAAVLYFQVHGHVAPVKFPASCVTSLILVTTGSSPNLGSIFSFRGWRLFDLIAAYPL